MPLPESRWFRSVRGRSVAGAMAESLAEACPGRVMRCEKVLRGRTGRVLLVLDRISDPHNEAAAHRTAEALGVQHVWSVAPILASKKKRPAKRDAKSVAKGADGWLSLRRFETPSDCVSALRGDGWEIWCASDGPGSIPLSGSVPDCVAGAPKVAIVIGREADGVDAAFLDAAAQRTYVEMRGFTTSLNLSVATALILQRVFEWFPHWVGDLDESERDALRESWRHVIAKNDTAKRKLDKWLEAPDTIPDAKHAATATGDEDATVACGSWAPKKVQAQERAVVRGDTG